MAKPIIVELRDDSARSGKPPVKNVPHDMVYGAEEKDGGSCRELFEYMLSPEPDEHNPDGYDTAQTDFANRWMDLYGRSNNDVNIQIALFGLTDKGTPRELNLDEKISGYISADQDSILKTESLTEGSAVQPYNSIDLIVQDVSTGGYAI